MDVTSGEFWYGLGIFLAIILSPVAVAMIITGVQILWERAWQRGYDEAWERAVHAQDNGIRLI
jgi:uncharacterized membrane protein